MTLTNKRPLLADFARRLAKALADPKPYSAIWSRLIGLPEAVPLVRPRRVPSRSTRR